MDTISISCFVCAYEMRNFTRAAEKLHISQPALSRRISMLEEEFGVKFFDRSAGGVKITDAGTVFYNAATQMMELEKKVRSSLRRFEIEPENRLVIGYFEGDFMSPLLHIRKEMQARHPEVELVFRLLYQCNVLRSLENGELDLVYGNRGMVEADSSMFVQTVAPNRMMILIPRGHRLWDRETVSASELQGETAIVSYQPSDFSFLTADTIEKMRNMMDAVISGFEKRGVRFADVVYMPSAEARLFEIAMGGGIGITGDLTRENLNAYKDDIRAVLCNDLRLDIGDYCLFYRKENAEAQMFGRCADSRGKAQPKSVEK